MEPVDIIVPVYGNVDLTLTCLESVRYYSKNYTLILIDNGSVKENFNSIEEELVKHEKVKLIKNYRNLGFVKAINQGLSVSTAPYVVLLNNDTEVTKNWLEKLYQPFQENHQLAAVGPVTNTEDCWQGKHPTKDGWMMCSKTTMLAFFCVMLKREVIEKIGLLDESFGVGFADDDDYCRRLHLAGYRIGLAESCFIYHAHRSTFNLLYTSIQIDEMIESNLEIFRKKHQIDHKGNKIG